MVGLSVPANQPARASSVRRVRMLLRSGLVLAFLLGVLLRFVGIGFGRGTFTARADEELLRSGVLISLTGDLNPHYAVWGHLFHYIYLAVVAVWLAGRSLLAGGMAWSDAVAALHCDPWTFIALGRAVSATVGAATLLVTYRLAHRALGSCVTAVGSCIVLSTLFLHVRDSHFATCDILLAFFSTGALSAMAGRDPLQRWAAGIWTGFAMASKLLAGTVVLTYFSTALWRDRDPSEVPALRAWCRRVLGFLVPMLAVMLITQPFLWLDPMETCYGLFGDLFNPERRPFEQGISLINASIVLRYYIPQGIGWAVAASAFVGTIRLLRRPRLSHEAVLIAYLLWFGIALVSVQRIFLRYLVPALPVLSIVAAHGVASATRWIARHKPGRVRLGLVGAITLLIALPNLIRSVLLDQRLIRDDTRAQAGDWIHRNVPAGSRILWSGYGSIAPHITMPWLLTTTEHDRDHAELRASRGLSTEVDERIIAWKREHAEPTYQVAALSFGTSPRLQSGFDVYPMLDYKDDFAGLNWLDQQLRRWKIVKRESPRWDLMRRHVIDGIVLDPSRSWTESSDSVLGDWKESEWLVLTGMPIDSRLIDLVSEEFGCVATFDPGIPWPEYGRNCMYDLGDAWYLPNLGVSLAQRPGPEIKVFRRR